jgi:predicted kinase
MDLWFRGRREAANRVLNAYLDEAGRSFPHTLWDGPALLPLLLATRASVRAHVTANQDEADAARAYLAAAASHLAPPPARLIAIGGLSGTGKTTLARRIAPDLGAAPGAVILRSDEIRKRLAGLGPLDRIPRGSYTSRRSAETYGEMFRLAGRLLDAGRTVVLDGVFLGQDLRSTAEGLALEAGVPFHGVWLEGRADELRARLKSRRGDASDADAATLEQQLRRETGRVDWAIADAGDHDAAAARLLALAAEN